MKCNKLCSLNAHARMSFHKFKDENFKETSLGEYGAKIDRRLFQAHCMAKKSGVESVIEVRYSNKYKHLVYMYSVPVIPLDF